MRGARLALPLLVALGASPARGDATRVWDWEIGGRLGTQLNLGGLGAGGVSIGGTFLYRVSQTAWIDTRGEIVAGGGGKHCYLGRDLATVCDPAPLSGAAIRLLVGPRLFFDRGGRYTPHVGAGVGLGYGVLGADDLAGVSFPLWLGGGVRTAIREGLSLGGELLLSGGPAHFDRDQGWGGFLAVTLVASIDFAL